MEQVSAARRMAPDHASRSLLTETQKALQTETGNLVKALREPQARGTMGRATAPQVPGTGWDAGVLRFHEQVSVTVDERRLRPDVVVQSPGEKNIVIDAKVPLAGYLARLEAHDEATRNAFCDHARQIRQHIESLAAK